MNPFDADTHPGPYLVVEVLGVGDVSVPALAPGPGEPLHQAATRVIEAAAALDERHESVLYAVRRSQRLLEGIGRGEVGRAKVSYALLRTALPELGDVLAQQDRAYSQLVESLSAYRRLPSSAEPAQRATNRGHGQGQKTRPDRDDDWAVAGERGLVALEAVAAGGVRFRRNAIGEDPYVSREKAQRQDPAVFPQTVQRLVADGLSPVRSTETMSSSIISAPNFSAWARMFSMRTGPSTPSGKPGKFSTSVVVVSEPPTKIELPNNRGFSWARAA